MTTARLITRRVTALVATLLALMLGLVLTRWDSDTPGERGVYIALPEQQLRASIAELANCPSPLDRLGIARAPRSVRETTDALIIVIPGASGSTASTVRFEFDGNQRRPGKQVHVTWQFTLGEDAQELDLEEERLLNPASFGKDLDQVLGSYLQYPYQPNSGTADAERASQFRASSCRSFGRLADGIAVVTSPALRAELTRQKRRDALGWLFSDSYHLKTESDPDADWEEEPDYPIGAPY